MHLQGNIFYRLSVTMEETICQLYELFTAPYVVHCVTRQVYSVRVKI